MTLMATVTAKVGKLCGIRPRPEIAEKVIRDERVYIVMKVVLSPSRVWLTSSLLPKCILALPLCLKEPDIFKL